MNKYLLTRFIDKYHLSGNVNSVVLSSDGTTLSTRFITGDKSLLGHLKLSEFDYFGKSELGVYNTETLTKLFGVLGDDIKPKVVTSDDKSISVSFNDGGASINFMLSDLSVINTPPALKSIPDFEVKVDITPQFISKFIAGKSALPEVDSFTVITKDDSVDIVINHQNINTNKVVLPVGVDEITDTIDNISFDANLFKEVLSANKECTSSTLEVSSGGLARINFKVDNYDATYYFVSKTDVD